MALFLLEAAAALSMQQQLADHALVPASPSSGWSSEAESAESSSLRARLSAAKDARASSKKPYRRPGQRDAQTHNTIEKRRRAELAANYTKLKTEIPDLAPRASNITILQSATELIQQLQEEEGSLLAELEEERARHAQLVHMWGGAKPAAAAAPVDGVVPSLEAATEAVPDGFQTAPASPQAAAPVELAADGLMLLAEMIHLDAKRNGLYA